VSAKALVLGAFLVVVAAAAAGVVAAKPAAAFPSKVQDCSKCHGLGLGTYGATVTATPSATTLAPGATYTVAVTISENPNGTFNTGYWIANSDAAGATGTSTGVYGGNTGTSQNHTATMTAPVGPGTYYYKVFAEDGGADADGVVGYKVYSINVVAPVHDVAVFGLVRYPRRSDVTLGGTGSYLAVYANVGTVSETFTATIKAKAPGGLVTTLDSRSITLAAGATTTVSYPGIVSFSSAGVWTITASVGPVTGETATADNTWSKSCTVNGSLLAARGRLVHRGLRATR
jgi:hypothetical protein